MHNTDASVCQAVNNKEFPQFFITRGVTEATMVPVYALLGVAVPYRYATDGIGDGPSQPLKINAKLLQERAEIHPILRFSASKIAI
jgi:hypothetical protein